MVSNQNDKERREIASSLSSFEHVKVWVPWHFSEGQRSRGFIGTRCILTGFGYRRINVTGKIVTAETDNATMLPVIGALMTIPITESTRIAGYATMMSSVTIFELIVLMVIIMSTMALIFSLRWWHRIFNCVRMRHWISDTQYRVRFQIQPARAVEVRINIINRVLDWR